LIRKGFELANYPIILGVTWTSSFDVLDDVSRPKLSTRIDYLYQIVEPRGDPLKVKQVKGQKLLSMAIRKLPLHGSTDARS
jgi:hypothetical protein